MNKWSKGLVASTAAIGVMAGSLVAGASAAQAAVGDVSVYDISPDPGDTRDLENIILGPDNLLWVFDDDDTEFYRVSASGEVRGVLPATDCTDVAHLASFAGSVWCFDDSTRALRFYPDGRRTEHPLPADFQRASSYSLTTTIGPDGRLWLAASATESKQEIPTVRNQNPEMATEMRLIAAPISDDGSFGPVVTLNQLTGTFERYVFDTGNEVAIQAGPDNKIYFSWSPGFNVYTGDVTNVHGTFTTDGVVASSQASSSPETTGANAVKSARIGDSIYVLGNRYKTVPWVQTINGVETPIVDDATNRPLYTMQSLNNSATLSMFTSPTTVTTQSVNTEVTGVQYGLTDFVADSNGYLWLTDDSEDEVVRISTAGAVAPRVSMPANEDPYAVVIGPDGNAWVAADDFLVRVLTGAVPTNAAAPTLSQVDGITVGTPISGTSGEWNDPSGTYEYQWQVCSSNDASTCTDIPGATAAQYTPSTSDDGKYVRMATYATSPNGRSEPAYSGLVAVGAPAAPPAANPGAAVKATGSTAVIGNAQTMELDVPRKTKRGKKKLYEVFFTATDVPGTVTFTFKRRSKVKTVTVPIEDGIAEYRWKTPRKWPRGKTRVTATYVPSAGSPYTAAAVTDRVKVRGR